MAKRLTGMSIADLRAEISRRQKALPKLRRQRARLAKELAAIDRKIASLAGRGAAPAPKAPTRRRKQMKNTKSLPDYIRQVLAGAKDGLRIKDIEAAVKKAGYRTASPHFYGAVATALRERSDFVRAGRGVYKLKGGAGAKAAAKKGRKRAKKAKAKQA